MNITQFSQQIGVSTATVSRAFSGKGRISDQTRRYVHEQAARVGYRPNLQARNMARRSTQTLAFFHEAPEKLDSDYYVGELACGLNDAAREAGYYLQNQTVPPDTEAPPEMMLDLILSRSIDGFIVNLRQPWAEPLFTAAQRSKVPYVIIDNTRPQDDVTLSIGDQIELAASRVGDYVRRIGRQRPAMIRGIHDERKLQGFRQGLGDLADHLHVEPGGKTFQAGFEAGTRLCEQQPDIDVLFCANDVLAIGAIRAASNRDIVIPDELAVIGCDNLAMSPYSVPALTTIHLPKYEMGHWSVRKLLGLIDNQPLNAHPNLECTLLVRQSA